MVFPTNIQKFLQALTNENRQRIMMLFAEKPVLTVSEVAEKTQLGMSTVSEHLKQLKDAGLLRSQKIGKEVEYCPNVAEIKSTLDALSAFMRKCC